MRIQADAILVVDKKKKNKACDYLMHRPFGLYRPHIAHN